MLKYFSLCLCIVFMKNVGCFDGLGINICEKSLTTVSGRLAPKKVCSKELIFEDNFEKFDFKKWKHENTLSGGGNWEFQWYTNNRSNSFVKDGKLFIKPTLTADYIGAENLRKMTLDINGASPANYCTDLRNFGCHRKGTDSNILNPIRSAKLTTVDSFAFKYGKLQVKAKLPTGDWLWPAIWLMPMYNEYGTWPTSGEIDVMESRGNKDLVLNDVNIGVEQMGSTLHWGPAPNINKYEKTHFTKNSDSLNKDFKVYEMIWTPDFFKFSLNDEEIGTIYPNTSFWKYGNLNESRMSNPWQYGSNFAPFDQEFYIILNLAVGGTNGYFPDGASNPTPKPWKNFSPTAFNDFWEASASWLPTWNMNENNGENSALQIESVKVWAL